MYTKCFVSPDKFQETYCRWAGLGLLDELLELTSEILLLAQDDQG
jgi:hypothetical protein